ncbi:sulfotransferase family protein [Alienimonas californiensis]|uniref:Sulfotransferase family protein n=1 Tax=Alienimonas californiensis TaxID=2527989 RepID=A0A517P7M3_9PLAN|nr:sulfotransferase family 2 domain-containing protein [Alienimonas californiensis]QDT15370.1 Sulfotransferase family protein [Alienimonas californiensis]
MLRWGPRPKPILFDHLPKCAGTSLIEFLKPRYPERESYLFDGRAPHESAERFLALPAEKRHAFRLIAGHGANRVLDAARSDLVLATLFRDPVERIVSHYFFARRREGHYLYARITGADGGGGVALEDYVDAVDSGELRNYYVAHFTGLTREQIDADPDAALRQALDVVLSRYGVIGFQDELPAAAARLRAATGLRGDFSKGSVNRTSTGDRDPVSEEARRRIAEANALDQRLYDQVRAAVLG